MKYIIYSSLIISTLFLFSCKDTTSVENGDTIQVTVSEEEIPLSNYMKSAKCLHLETSKEAMIGNVTKVIIFENNIYILDNIARSVFRYDMDGRFLSKLNAVGSGPGEYINVNDFDIDDGKIYLMDYNQNKILIYSSDFKHIKQVKEDKFFSNIAVTKGKIILYGNNYNPEGGHSFTVINENDGGICQTFLPYKDISPRKYDLTMGFCFNKDADENVLLSKSFSDTVYKYENNSLNKFAIYDFGVNKLPYDSINDIFLFDPNISYLFKGNFFVYKNILLTNIFNHGKTVFNIYNFNSGKSITGKIKNDLAKMPFFPMWSSQGYVIQCLSPEIYNKYCTNNQINKEDNPVLVLYSLK